MTDQTGSPAGGEAIFSTELPADAPEVFDTPKAAADYFADLKAKKATDPAVAKKAEPAESAEPLRDIATADEEELVSKEADAAPETDPGEEPEGNEPEAEKLPPIERPRSWSKDADDDWNAIPRERQEKIAANELAREADIRQRINEAAEKAKALTAKEQALEQTRQDYEAKARSALAILEREQLGQFPDIKTMDDVRRLASEDPFRYMQWDAHQKEMVVAHQAVKDADARKESEHFSQWSRLIAEENAKFIERVPEFADESKAKVFKDKAGPALEQLGFTQSELAELMNGRARLSIFDHRLQQLLVNSMKLADIQNAPKPVAAKQLPPVQRPGTSRPSGQGVASERIQALNRKSELTVKEATELYTLQQRPRRAS